MKIFLQRELYAAYDHAAKGGQALHLCESRAFVTDQAPGCFRRSRQFAHLFDQDYTRLVSMAHKLGVRVIVPERIGERGQHVDLCGKPLDRAIDLAHEIAEQEKTALEQLTLLPS